jgi:ketosteroid isomerase-like protein
MTTLTFADVAEGVRATLAAYTHALDDGRTEDIIATYLPDGVFDMPGTGTFEGHEALRAIYEEWKPRLPQRHMVVNTLVTDLGDHQASAESDVVFALKGDKGWRIQFVARYLDVLRHDPGDGRWKFQRRTVST